MYILKKCVNLEGVVQYVKHEIVDQKLIIYTKFAGLETLHNHFFGNGKNNIERIRNDIYNIVDSFKKLNILHMDLKPKNCVLDKKGNVTIVDFGWSMTSDFPMESDELEYYNSKLDWDKVNIDLYLV